MAGLLAAICCAAPTLLVLAFQADYLVIANESAAYRFFYVQRLIDREPAIIFLPQGYLSTLVHRIVYSLAVREHPLGEALRPAMTTWGVASGLFWHGALAVGLLLFLRRPALATSERLAVLVAAVAPLLCTGTNGFYYLLLPDYYQANTILAALTVAIFLVVLRQPEVSLPMVGLLGVWAGLVASNKITWLPFGALVLAPVLAARVLQPGRLLLTGVMAGCAAAVTFVLVHVAVYGGDAARVVHLAPIWFRHIQSFGTEPNFWDQFVSLYLFAANTIWIVAIFAVVAAVVAARSRRCQWVTLLLILLVIGNAIVTLLLKPAGTTVYDTLTMVLAGLAMLIGGWHTDPISRRCGYAAAACLGLLAVLTFRLSHNYAVVATSGERSAVRWEIHRALLEPGRPSVFVWPNNEFQFVSVQEALIKGFTNRGSALITTGQVGVDRIAPGQTFRVDHGTPLPSDPYPGGITLGWVDRTDRESLTGRYPALADAATRAGDNCRRWEIERIRVTVCHLP